MRESTPLNPDPNPNPSEHPGTLVLLPTSWGFQSFLEGVVITVFTPEDKPVSQSWVTWEQMEQVKARGTTAAPFPVKALSDSMTPLLHTENLH